MRKRIVSLFLVLVVVGCGSTSPVDPSRDHYSVQKSVNDALEGSKFEPNNNRVMVIAGQNLFSTRGYYQLEGVPKPAGFTDYVSYQVGDLLPAYAPDYPKRYLGNDGVFSVINWGGGEQCADCLLKEPEFDQAVVSLGFYMGGPIYADGSTCSGKDECHVARLARGEYDEQLTEFSTWLKRIQRPVFLRVGYEFDGSWNGYTPEHYKAAFKYVKRFLDSQGVSNVAYVFQSFGFASRETLDAYYPEPDEQGYYVDWVGYSHFNMDYDKPGQGELAFAREKGLKVFIAEVTPHSGDCAKQIDVESDADTAKAWIDGFLAHVEKNRDVVRAIAYINARWKDASYSPMWSSQKDHNCPGYFALSNARLNDNGAVARYWGQKISAPIYLNKEPDLYHQLSGWQ